MKEQPAHLVRCATAATRVFTTSALKRSPSTISSTTCAKSGGGAPLSATAEARGGCAHQLQSLVPLHDRHCGRLRAVRSQCVAKQRAVWTHLVRFDAHCLPRVASHGDAPACPRELGHLGQKRGAANGV